MFWGPLLAGAGMLLGKASGASQGQKNQEEANQIARDRQELDRYLLGLRAPGMRLDTSLQGSMIKNHQPVKANWGGPGSGLAGRTVEYTGGAANPDIIDPRLREQADDVIGDELIQQTAYDEVEMPEDKGGSWSLGHRIAKDPTRAAQYAALIEKENARRGAYSGGPPKATPPKKSSFMDKLMGGLGMGASIGSLFFGGQGGGGGQDASDFYINGRR